MDSETLSEIIVEISKENKLVKIMISLLFVGFGLFITFKIQTSWLLGIAGIVLLILIAPTAIGIIRVCLSNKPLLKVTREGITTWNNKYRFVFHPWEEVEKIKVERKNNQVALIFHMNKAGKRYEYSITEKEFDCPVTEMIERISVLKRKYS